MMKKFILMLILFGVSNVVMAEWTFISANGDNTTYFYADYSTIKRSKSLVKMWMLASHTIIRTRKDLSGAHLSSKNYDEYDCENKTSRALTMVTYKGMMGFGDVVSTSDFNNGSPDDKYIPIVPNSMGEIMWEVACGNKK